jgi:choline dehydrogenase-like flavoprotein
MAGRGGRLARCLGAGCAISMSAARRYDLVVVGAGLVGGLLAAKATRLGKSVALIEAGPRFDFSKRSAQLRHHQVFGGPRWPYEVPERDRYTDSSLQSIGVSYLLESHRLKGVGGSTLHWGARINRLMPTDFRSASSFGTGVDWPISYDELEPYYSAADWELGVSGNHDASLPHRSRPYPNPGFPPTVDDQMWLPIAERLGISIYPTAFAINSQPYGGRSPCVAFAACESCPSGARYSADFHIAEAEKTGLCDVFSNTVARRIEMNAAGAVRNVQVSTLDKQEREIEGTNFVVAAHAIESARLLLLSKCGNHSDQVGRNFMEHVYLAASGLKPEKRFYPKRVGYEVLESISYYTGKDRRERGGIKAEFLFSDWDPLHEMESRRLWGKPLARFDKENFGHWAGIETQCEHQPNPDSRISLDPTVRDLFGDPVPHLNLAFSDVDLRTQRRAREVMQELLQAADVKEITQDKFSSYSFGAHHMGTCRMSDDPDHGVVDRDCRVHGVSNLYVVGGSVFPSAGALQPSLTIAALALRMADHLWPA